MKQRIIGFDLARAYAIFGMFIVNFNFSFGSFGDDSVLGNFLNLFIGNSTSVFIILAGMGVSFMSNRNNYSIREKSALRAKVLKRSWFLFVSGLLLYSWWPGDILHFYGGYMHIAAFLLFVPKKYYLLVGCIAILVFHILLFVIPVETGWDFNTFAYSDFWTLPGFLRNTLYNGWNSVFPWIAYFLLGMWLGRLDWSNLRTRKKVFLIGLIIFLLFEGIRFFGRNSYFNEYWTHYTISDYFPCYIPFMFITMGYALIVIPICMFFGDKFPKSALVNLLAKTGQMTLTLYVIHITIGMLLFSFISDKNYSGLLAEKAPSSPLYILTYAICFFIVSVGFCKLWSYKFKNGPIEAVMRRFSG